jgi:hypothetical protein
MNVEESSGDGDFSCGGPLGNLGSPSTGNFRDGWRALEREASLFCGSSVRGLFFGDPEGGLREWTLFFS